MYSYNSKRSRTYWTHLNLVCLSCSVESPQWLWSLGIGSRLKRVKATQTRSMNPRAWIISLCHHHQPILECLSESYTKWVVIFTVLTQSIRSTQTRVPRSSRRTRRNLFTHVACTRGAGSCSMTQPCCAAKVGGVKCADSSLKNDHDNKFLWVGHQKFEEFDKGLPNWCCLYACTKHTLQARTWIHVSSSIGDLNVLCILGPLAKAWYGYSGVDTVPDSAAWIENSWKHRKRVNLVGRIYFGGWQGWRLHFVHAMFTPCFANGEEKKTRHFRWFSSWICEICNCAMNELCTMITRREFQQVRFGGIFSEISTTIVIRVGALGGARPLSAHAARWGRQWQWERCDIWWEFWFAETTPCFLDMQCKGSVFWRAGKAPAFSGKGTKGRLLEVWVAESRSDEYFADQVEEKRRSGDEEQLHH